MRRGTMVNFAIIPSILIWQTKDAKFVVKYIVSFCLIYSKPKMKTRIKVKWVLWNKSSIKWWKCFASSNQYWMRNYQQRYNSRGLIGPNNKFITIWNYEYSVRWVVWWVGCGLTEWTILVLNLCSEVICDGVWRKEKLNISKS